MSILEAKLAPTSIKSNRKTVKHVLMFEAIFDRLFNVFEPNLTPKNIFANLTKIRVFDTSNKFRIDTEATLDTEVIHRYQNIHKYKIIHGPQI